MVYNLAKQTFHLVHETARQRAREAVYNAPDGSMVVVQDPTRNLDQNSALWAALGDISKQVDWYGQKLTAEEWKHVFTASLKKQKVVPGLDGGFVVLGLSTSKMSKREFSELLDLAYAFGAEHNVRFEG